MFKPLHQLRRFSRSALVAASASLATSVMLSSWLPPARAGFPPASRGGYIHITQVQQAPSSLVYGSPIPAPVPVNSVTGSTSSTIFYGVAPGGYSTRGSVVNPTLVNPTVINPPIYNSTPVYPTVVGSPAYPGTVIVVPSYPQVFGVPSYPYPYPRTVIRGSFGISY